MLGIQWHHWKHAMHAYATAKKIPIPKGFTPGGDGCGRACVILLKRIQHHAGLAQDGIIGPRTAFLLRPWFPADGTRDRVCEVADWGVRENALIGYGQIRPMNFNPTLPKTMDCSWYVTFDCYWGGAPDPNGLHYSGNGNTETMYNHLPRIGLGDQHLGDLIIFGGAVIQRLSHVVIAREGGTDPLVDSHGFSGGPLQLKLSVEKQFHGGLPMTVHRLL
jgi:hypothetical protein